MIPNLTKGSGITGAMRYALGEGKRDEVTGLHPTLQEGEVSRVTWISGQNFGFAIDSLERLDVARRMMEWEAQNQTSRTRQCAKDALHLSLSWHPDEKPDTREMEEAARSALKALGMATARAAFVAHEDTGHAHLHIVASRINPETGKAFSDKFDQKKINTWAKDWEIEHGRVLCEGRLTPQELAAHWRERPERVLTAITKNQPTFSRDELLRTLGQAIAGDENRAAFADHILARHQVVGLRETAEAPVTRYTTREVLAAEWALTKDAAGLAAATGHSVNAAHAQAALEARPWLADEQRAAFAHVIGAAGFAMIAGEAGTGKSATLAAVREAYEASGHQVIGLAWTNAVSQDMRRDGFGHARTIASELMRLEKGAGAWDARTVLIVDEAAMLATEPLGKLAATARAAGAKLILAGDDRQLASIERGGMFATLRSAHGAAELHEVRRVADPDQQRAFNLMHKGDFAPALRIFEERGAIQWTATQDEARAALVARYVADAAAAPDKLRFAFAYTNADVHALNRDIRAARQARGELGPEATLATAAGEMAFAPGDRIQFTGNAYRKALRDAGLVNGNVGTICAIAGTGAGARVTVALDGKKGEEAREVSFTVGDDAKAGEFRSFRHGYAGTIYKGQGRTLDQSYLYHSPHWRAASSYVALSRHREEVAVFVARASAPDLAALARQMGRVDARRAASAYIVEGPPVAPETTVALEATVAPAPTSPAPTPESGRATASWSLPPIVTTLDGGMVAQQREALRRFARNPTPPHPPAARQQEAVRQAAEKQREETNRQAADSANTLSSATRAARAARPSGEMTDAKQARQAEQERARKMRSAKARGEKDRNRDGPDEDRGRSRER